MTKRKSSNKEEFEILIVDEKVWNKDIASIPLHLFQNIKKKIKLLSQFPNRGDFKKLKSYSIADYRLRVGSYRVLFDVDQKSKKILLYRVLHRKDSYN